MRYISATQLAKLGKCERQIYLDNKYGEDKSLVRQDIKRGDKEHEEFRLHLTGKDKRCFIATAIFGAMAPETIALRCWRDEWLLNCRIGRLGVNIYYQFSPAVVNLLFYIPGLSILLRYILRCLLAWISKRKDDKEHAGF